jgi:hypothetical protein
MRGPMFDFPRVSDDGLKPKKSYYQALLLIDPHEQHLPHFSTFCIFGFT